MKTGKNMEWIPVSERLPEQDKYILLSFSNFTMADIGRYEIDKDGNGSFYPGDEDYTYASCGSFVNAWMPLPEPYRENNPDKNNFNTGWKEHIINRFTKGE